MNCNECAPLLEDLLYHKLSATTENELVEHLTACNACAGEYALLSKEQELYGRCEFQIAPQFWTGVQARIASENGSRAGRFASLFNVFHLPPLGAAVACLFVVLGLIGAWRYFDLRREQTASAEFNDAPPVSVATTDPKSSAVQGTESRNAEQAPSDGVKRNPSSRRLLVSQPMKLKSPDAREYARKIEKPTVGTDIVVKEKQVLAAQARTTSDLDADSARHLEQVEMLLRSFKNGRLLRHGNTLDLKYESRLSKDLLVQNVLLRHDAELAGDVPLSRLLDRFEPFLLDIANLRTNSDAKEIRLIRENLTKAEIISALHAF